MSRQNDNIPMRIRRAVDAQSGGAVIRVAGEIEMATAPLLHDTVVGQLKARHHTTVDLADVTFMDAAGVRVLIQAHHTAIASQRRLTVANATGLVARVLRLTGADQILSMAEPDR
jgi:anti-anti-sigma factor